MAAGVTIKLKRKAGAFINGDLAAGELGLDVTNSKLYASNDGSTVYQLDVVGLLNIVDDLTPQFAANVDAQGFRVTNLGTPSGGGDAATKAYVDGVAQGLSWEEPVLNTQTDATLDPGATPTLGDRYIIENSGSLHANFGTITGVGDDDIVEFDGSDFVVEFDASVSGEGSAVYDKTSNSTKVFNGSAWVAIGGSVDHGSVTGLGDDDHTQYSLITSGSGAPGSTPARAGAIHIDTSGDNIYVATGASTSADWTRVITPTSTLNNAGMTIDGGTI